MKKRILSLSALLLSLSLVMNAQTLMPQHYYKKNVPAGNYSGLTSLGGNRYAVVNDKPINDGFDIFNIDIDYVTGEIINVRKVRTLTSGKQGGRDGEGIAYFPSTNTVFISGEADNKVLEYDMNGHLTGRQLHLPATVNIPVSNYGLESLTYNAHTHRFWTTTESTLPQDGQQANAVNGIRNHLRLMSFDDNLQYCNTINYIMDEPISTTQAKIYANGVSALCALDNGELLVLEREAFVPKKLGGAWCVNRVYSINTTAALQGSPSAVQKTANGEFVAQKKLVAMWRTSFNLLHKDFANYEGMCVGPKLTDGRQVIILCADSQNQYGKLLRDWFRTIIL